jgi:hypothetical protein
MFCDRVPWRVQAGRLEEAAAMLQAAGAGGMQLSCEVCDSFLSASLATKKYNAGIQGLRYDPWIGSNIFTILVVILS